jgi:hypothetical protein
MSGDAWLSIEYREFYDIPRSVVVQRNGVYYYLESLFDEQIDDYSEFYTVYRLPQTFEPDRLGASWIGLSKEGTPVGRIRTSAVKFDATRRKMIADDAFDHLEPLTH